MAEVWAMNFQHAWGAMWTFVLIVLGNAPTFLKRTTLLGPPLRHLAVLWPFAAVGSVVACWQPQMAVYIFFPGVLLGVLSLAYSLSPLGARVA